MSLTAAAVRVAAAIAMTCAVALLPGTALATPGAPGSHTGPGTPVPASFKANSVTWVSAQRGWVLGAARCGKNTCSDVIGTSNGGKTWQLTGTVKAPIANVGKGRPGITEIRYSTPAVGWAFGPFLFRTGDGGKSWARMPVPGGGKQVLALAASGTQNYAVVSDCAFGKGVCPKPLSFWRIATKPGARWTHVPLNLPKNLAPDVAVLGKTVYVVDQQLEFGQPDKFYASTDGVHFAARPAPCDHAKDLALIQAVPMSATRVALLCVGNAGSHAPGDATKDVYTSANTGTTDTYAGATGPPGVTSQLAASPSGNLAVAALSAGSFLYINDTHQQAWTMVKGLSDSAGWNDITYSNNSQAWVVYGPADLRGIGQLWATHDAGLHWSIVNL
jgi:hypothetical protein